MSVNVDVVATLRGELAKMMGLIEEVEGLVGKRPAAAKPTKTDFERQLIALDARFPGKLSEMMLGVIAMYKEYLDVHGFEDEAAQWAGINEVFEGTKAMIYLEDDDRLHPDEVGNDSDEEGEARTDYA